MHLTRVQIPEFRALKNVDITFEKDFTPKIFPLGSENGGGKSTLLQLIFVLLHCTNHSAKSAENLLARYEIPEGVNQQTLAKMDIWDGEKTVQIEFLCCNDDFLNSISNTQNLSFSILSEERNRKKRLELLEKELNEDQNTGYSLFLDEEDSSRLQQERKQFIELRNQQYASAKLAYELLSSAAKPLLECLHTERYLYITTYSETEALLCRVCDFPLDTGKSFLSELSEKVFLVAPSTQVYLFMPEKEKKLIFKAYQRASYELAVIKTKTELPHFFTYDFFSTDIITQYFKDARNARF
jgi:predicted ATP-dependent endonuclease of OLD family